LGKEKKKWIDAEQVCPEGEVGPPVRVQEKTETSRCMSRVGCRLRKLKKGRRTSGELSNGAQGITMGYDAGRGGSRGWGGEGVEGTQQKGRERAIRKREARVRSGGLPVPTAGLRDLLGPIAKKIRAERRRKMRDSVWRPNVAIREP